MDDSAKKLDQFFTQDEVAARCLSSILAIVKQLEYDLDKIRILEPSAGDGAFIRAADSKGIGSYLIVTRAHTQVYGFKSNTTVEIVRYLYLYRFFTVQKYVSYLRRGFI